MKVLKIGIILVVLLCASILITQSVNAEEEASAAVDVNTIKLPQLQYDNIQEKVTVDNELSPDYSTIVTSMVMSAVELKESTISKIPIGAIIHHSKDGVTRVFDSSGKQILYSEDIKAGKIATPTGFKPATYVHEVPSGSVIQSKNNVLFVIYQKKLILSIISENNEELLATKSSSSVLGVTDRWIEWVKTFYSEKMGIGEFTTTWKVPAAPKKTHIDYSSGYTSVIHLFDGIGNSNGLVQPVLSWHYAKSPSIPRPLSWTGAAWALWGDTADIHSPSINVAIGDDIQGHMKWDNVQKLWYIKFTDQTTGEITNLYSGVVSNNEVYLYPGVLECFFTEPGNDYLPGNAIFSNFIIKKVNEKPFTPKLDLPEYQDTLINQFRLIKGANGLFVDIDSWPNKIILYTAYPPPIFIISPNAGNHGIIAPSVPVTVQAGGSQTFTISPDQGYVVEDVKVNKESV